MNPSASELLKRLRERTGVGIGKCKEALGKAQGDIEKAIDILRKMGIASVVKKEERETNEGSIVTATNGDAVALVEINAETDFVVKNQLFKNFSQDMALHALQNRPSSLMEFLSQPSNNPSLTIDQQRAIAIQSLGENIRIKRFLIIIRSFDESIGVYSHMGGKIVALVKLQGKGGEHLAHEIAMHVAAESPDYLSPEEIPEADKEREKEIVRSQIAGRPNQVMEKIIEGKMNAFYERSCLLRQKFIKDPSLSILSLVEAESKKIGVPFRLKQFVRWQVGG